MHETRRERIPTADVELGRLAVMAATGLQGEQRQLHELGGHAGELRHWAKSAGLNWIRAMAEADGHYRWRSSEEAEIGDVPRAGEAEESCHERRSVEGPDSGAPTSST